MTNEQMLAEIALRRAFWLGRESVVNRLDWASWALAHGRPKMAAIHLAKAVEYARAESITAGRGARDE